MMVAWPEPNRDRLPKQAEMSGAISGHADLCILLKTPAQIIRITHATSDASQHFYMDREIVAIDSSGRRPRPLARAYAGGFGW